MEARWGPRYTPDAPLMVGRTFNHYRVDALLGSGGMGDVYRARDTRLDRDVAIKFVSAAFTRDPQRLERLEREARLLASLNHPNIATVHGFEEADGERFLVMELVPGRTLHDVITERRADVRCAVDVARQIASALEGAHDRGIIHRDLKPANIKVTPGDVVKVLDFGLAKSVGGQSEATAPTVSGTLAGVVVGTPGYMSPEQARGEDIDRLTDIWAFGCVLFELLVGRPTFAGTGTAERTAAVLTREPDWNALPAETPGALRKLLQRCLAKDRKRRYRDAGDLRLDLDEVFDADAALPAPRTSRSSTGIIGTGLFLGVAIIVATVWPKSPLAETWSSELMNVRYKSIGPRVSPDGQTLAFQAMKDGLTQLTVFKPSSGDFAVQLLTDDRRSGIINEISWSADGTRLYYDRYGRTLNGIFSVPLLGGQPRLILEGAKAPHTIADGSLLVTRINDQRQNQLYRYWPQERRLQPLSVLLPRTSEVWTPPVRVFADGKDAVFYGRPLETPDAPNELHAIDLANYRVRRLAPALHIRPTTEYFGLSIDPEGRFALVDLPDGDLHRIVRVPRDGSSEVRTAFTLTMAPWFIDMARDGSVYVDQVDRPSELLRFAPAGGPPEQLGIAPGFVAYGHGGAISLSDGRVLMASIQGGRNRLLVTDADGLRPFLETNEETAGPITSLGSHEVAFVEGNGDARKIAIASIPDDRITRRITPPAGDVTSINASPDGGRIYCVASGALWSSPATGAGAGSWKRLLEADGMAVDPSNGDLIVQIFGAEGVTLTRFPVRGGSPQPIRYADESFVMWPIPLSSNAVAADGRILVQGGRTDTWSYVTGVIDPAAHSVNVVPLTFDGDLIVPGWTRDGHIVSFGFRYRMNLWRFRRSAE